MSKIRYLFMVVTCMVFNWVGVAQATNLIINPGNESPLVNGEIPGWTEIVDNSWTQASSNPAPFEGQFYFFAGSGALAELAQVVDVTSYASDIDSGLQSFAFEGRVRTFDQSPSDTARIILEYLNAADSILDTFDSGAVVSTAAWQLVSDTRLAPASTRSVRVRLISDRNAGTNNDGYFDALSLVAVPEPSSSILAGLGGLLAFGMYWHRRQCPFVRV